MEYQDEVRWLKQYQDSLRREHELALEVERLRTEAERITPSLSGMPGNSSDKDKLPRAVCAIIQAQQQLECQINCCGAIRREIVEVINTIGNERQHEVLRRRYLLGQRFEQIACEMNLDYRWVRRLHNGAICILTLKSPI